MCFRNIQRINEQIEKIELKIEEKTEEVKKKNEEIEQLQVEIKNIEKELISYNNNLGNRIEVLFQRENALLATPQIRNQIAFTHDEGKGTVSIYKMFPTLYG